MFKGNTSLKVQKCLLLAAANAQLAAVPRNWQHAEFDHFFPNVLYNNNHTYPTL